jgi:hypothetical protein
MEEKKFLTRAEMLAVSDILVEDVHIPEWDTYVHVRGMTGAQRDAYEDASLSMPDKKKQTRAFIYKDARARLVAWSVVDENGKRVFSDADIPRLSEKSAAALQRIFNVAMRLSGISEEDIEELVKNSPDGQSDDSGTS